MERLTERTTCGVANLAYPKSCYFQDGTKDPVAVSAYRQLAIDRLAAYEDTGLEPEEVAELISPEAVEIARLLEQMFKEGSAQHMLELFQAEKDGRLVLLPCKVGGEVYSTLDDAGRLHQCRVNYAHIDEREYLNMVALEPVDCDGAQYGAAFGAFGKTVFPTREEAEAALTDTNVGNMEGEIQNG